MTQENKNIIPESGYRYVCIQDCKGKRYIKGKVYYCERPGWLKDNDNNSWSFEDDTFMEYFIEEELLWKIVQSISFETLLKIKFENILK